MASLLLALAAALALTASSCDGRGGDDAAARPNVVLVSVDGLGARHLPVARYRHETMPYLHELAVGGAQVALCSAASTGSIESHMSMLTGRWPSDHAVHGGPFVLEPGVATLAETLRKAGYRTAAFSEDGALPPSLGFARGFEVFEDRRGPAGHVRETLADAATWAASTGGQPFFAFVETASARRPYLASPGYRFLFLEGHRSLEAEDLGPVDRQRIQYDQELRFVDDELRRFHLRLGELGLAGRTVVIVTSPRGTSFLEHGWMDTGSWPYEEQTSVPLVMHGPGIGPGAFVLGHASHVDLVPTVAELAGIAPPDGLPGISLLPWMRGGAESLSLPPRLVVTEAWSPRAIGLGGVPHPMPAPVIAATRFPRKLLGYPGPDGKPRYELYQLAADPGEAKNLWPAHALSSPDLQRDVDGWRTRWGLARLARNRPPATPAAGSAAPR